VVELTTRQVMPPQQAVQMEATPTQHQEAVIQAHLITVLIPHQPTIVLQEAITLIQPLAVDIIVLLTTLQQVALAIQLLHIHTLHQAVVTLPQHTQLLGHTPPLPNTLPLPILGIPALMIMLAQANQIIGPLQVM